MPPRQTLKVTIYACAGPDAAAVGDDTEASMQRSSLCSLLAACALSQHGFDVTLVGPHDPHQQQGGDTTVRLTKSLRGLLSRLQLLTDHDGDATMLYLGEIRARVLAKVKRDAAQLFRYIATGSPASFEALSSSSSPTLLLADGTRIRNDVLLCCDPAPSILYSCLTLPSASPSAGQIAPLPLFHDLAWSANHRTIFGPAAYSVETDGRRESPSSVGALKLSQWLLDALSLSFVLTQAAIPHAVGVALQVFSDVRREHLRSLAELFQIGERADEKRLEGFMQRDWLAELEDSWSRRYLSNI